MLYCIVQYISSYTISIFHHTIAENFINILIIEYCNKESLRRIRQILLYLSQVKGPENVQKEHGILAYKTQTTECRSDCINILIHYLRFL